jgi:hypothetical protein
MAGAKQLVTLFFILVPAGGLWRPRFLISVISTNGRISRVKPADSGQT